jgi:hypothetical protein
MRERDELEDLGVNGRIILNGCQSKWVKMHGLDLSGSGCGQMRGWCGSGDKRSASIICRKILDWILMKDFASWRFCGVVLEEAWLLKVSTTLLSFYACFRSTFYDGGGQVFHKAVQPAWWKTISLPSGKKILVRLNCVMAGSSDGPVT